MLTGPEEQLAALRRGGGIRLRTHIDYDWMGRLQGSMTLPVSCGAIPVAATALLLHQDGKGVQCRP